MRVTATHAKGKSNSLACAQSVELRGKEVAWKQSAMHA